MTGKRRTKAQISVIDQAIYDTVKMYKPMTLRQLFYQLVSQGVIEKTEAEYKGTVGRRLTVLRENGKIPYTWIADNTRWMGKPRTYDDAEHAINTTAEFYRRALWNDQPAYVEVWLEKDALAGVILDVTREFDVPLMVTRGYPSLSFQDSAASEIKEHMAAGKSVHLFYLGDHDPSGKDIPRSVQQRLREFGCEFTFTQLAVDQNQIGEYGLVTRPTKATDTRSKNWTGGESVEVDAIPPDELRRIVRDAIEAQIDPHALSVTKKIEAEERAVMLEFAANFAGR